MVGLDCAKFSAGSEDAVSNGSTWMADGLGWNVSVTKWSGAEVAEFITLLAKNRSWTVCFLRWAVDRIPFCSHLGSAGVHFLKGHFRFCSCEHDVAIFSFRRTTP